MQSPEGEPTDSELLGRIRKGDHAAFEELFRGYYEDLCGFVESRIGESKASEDLVQNIFLNLWRRREDLTIRTSIKAYLFGAARHESLDYREKKRVRNQWEREKKETLQIHFDRFGPASDTEHRELKREVQKFISELPERRREVYVLSRKHGLTHKEIASVMDISPKTVDNQMVKALKFLREQLRTFSLSPTS